MENQPHIKTLSNEKIIITDDNPEHCASGYDSSWVKSFPWHITKKDLKDNVTGNQLNFLVVKEI